MCAVYLNMHYLNCHNYSIISGIFFSHLGGIWPLCPPPPKSAHAVINIILGRLTLDPAGMHCP